MSETIKGYQFSPKDGRYIGEYEFPNNLDKEEIHLPPNTVLEPPPVGDYNDVAYWRGNAWELVIVPNDPYVPPIEDYLLITDLFIQYLKDIGRWSDEDQKKRDDAIAAEAQRQKEIDEQMARRKAEIEAMIAGGNNAA